MEQRSSVCCAIAAFVVCVAMTSASEDVYSCAFTEYFNRERMECAPCSICDNNQVPLRQCYKDKDTRCGKLMKFQFPVEDLRTEQTNKLPSAPEKSQERQQTLSTTMFIADNSADDKWFTITMVLVGILVFSCVVGMVLLFFTCYVCKKKQREIICDPVFTSALLKDEPMTPPKMQQFKIIMET